LTSEAIERLGAWSFIRESDFVFGECGCEVTAAALQNQIVNPTAALKDTEMGLGTELD